MSTVQYFSHPHRCHADFKLMELTLSTLPPSPPASLFPIQPRVCALLRSTCNNTSSSIAGRDVERTSLLQFLTQFIDGTSIDHDTQMTSMFIFGAPGTGKTALVNAIIHNLQVTAKNKHVKVISINCMALKSVDALWERIIEDLAITPRRKPATKKKTNSYDRLKALLSTLNTQQYVINIIFNYLTQARARQYPYFRRTRSCNTKFSVSGLNFFLTPLALRFIGIGNTYTLTTSSTSATFTPSKNVQTIHFAPYTPTQLHDTFGTPLHILFSVVIPLWIVPLGVYSFQVADTCILHGSALRWTLSVAQALIHEHPLLACTPSRSLSTRMPWKHHTEI